MNLFLDNAFGIQALTTVNSITASNSMNNNSVSLTHPEAIGQDILLTRATNPPLLAHTQFYEFDQNTSNIKAFFEVLPDQITTDLKIISRPNGSNDYTDFVKDESYLRARLNVVMPVQFSADNLTLVEKQPFDFNSLENAEKIKSGSFKLKVLNDYPFDAEIKVEFLNEVDEVLLPLFASGEKIEAAQINGATGKTDEAALSYLTATISEQQMDIIRESTKVRITSVFDSPNGSPNKIFSDYLLKTQLSADFVYEQTL
jgi:hypothetical protein